MKMKMKKMIRFFAIICLATFLLFPSFAACKTQNAGKGFYQHQKEMDDQWNQLASDTKKGWSNLQKTAEANWAVFVKSTQKEWVNYDRSMQTRSRVDFENGKIEIETVLPQDGAGAIEQAADRIADSVKIMLGDNNTTGQTILQNQIKDKSGHPVDSTTVSSYVKNELIFRIAKDSYPYITKNGSRKSRYFVSIKMVPNHIDIRARQYLPIVETNAKRFNLDPKLILAIIHTESYFNPLAISHAGAIGLMQIIPKYAGREAYTYLYGQDWTIKADYLYSPGVNIELGSAYLHLLMNNYFGFLVDDEKRLFVSICAYNWGPTSITKKIMNKYGATDMDAAALYALLRKKTPKETQDYLKKVTERMNLYAPYFGS
jgi:membrane-bound lytic murein transglycosylase C